MGNKEMNESNFKVGDRVRVKDDVIKPADDYSPVLCYARGGEILIVRDVADGELYLIKISHEDVLSQSFGVNADEIELEKIK
jgi:hypothetical protein